MRHIVDGPIRAKPMVAMDHARRGIGETTVEGRICYAGHGTKLVDPRPEDES